MAASGNPNIVIIDYESGNLRSVARAVERAGVTPNVTSDSAALDAADGVILPGVGSGPAAMAALQSRGLVRPLLDYIAGGRPFLGVCLGLQLLLDATDEGDADCLGLVSGRVRRLPDGLKVPHMGWNTVRFQREASAVGGHRAGQPLLLRTQLLRRPGGAGRRGGPHRVRRGVLQHLRPRQRGGNSVPPGEERRDGPAHLRQLRAAGGR